MPERVQVSGTAGRPRRPGPMSLVWIGLVASLMWAGPSPASAAECPDADGVTVVVDFSSLGGGPEVGCAAGSPSSGLDALQGAGFGVIMVQNQPGFVCRIDTQPDDPCIDTPPADAHWSYWHAERGGSWTASVHGATLWVPAPGTVEGWSFSTGTAQPPSVPPPAAPTTTTTAAPTTTTTTTEPPTTTTTTAPAATTTITTTTTTPTTTVATNPPPSTAATMYSPPTTPATTDRTTTTAVLETIPDTTTTTDSTNAALGEGDDGGSAVGTLVGVATVLGVVSASGLWVGKRRGGAIRRSPH